MRRYASLMALMWVAGIAPLLLVPTLAQPRFDLGPRGEVMRLGDGAVTYFTDIGVSVIRPGWSGSIVDQRTAPTAGVSKSRKGDATVFTMELRGDEGSFKLRETVRSKATRMELAYELIPDRDVACETVMLSGSMPVATHAGTTQYVVASSALTRGMCPATLPTDRVLYGGPADWMAFAAKDARALVLEPKGLTLQFQDDRAFEKQHFTLLASAAGGKLAAGKPIRFSMAYELLAPQALEARARAAGRNDLASLTVGDNRKLRIASVTCDAMRVRAYETVEVLADIAGKYDNPFDPDQIAVDADVTAPGGRNLRVPGFFGVPMRVERTGSSERLRTAGKAGFRIRYTPRVAGVHRIVVTARDRSGVVRAKPVEISVTSRKASGFIGVNKARPAYFADETGKPFIAIGENLCWANSPTPLATYAFWLKGLGKSGANWVRLWLAYNEKGLEWSAAPSPKPGTGTYAGLGRYALDNAWRLDEIVRMAEKNGVRLMFCIGTYGEFTEGGYFGEGMWPGNPYNKANGGPCEKPADFWTNPEARKLYQRRLRYLIARYGHSPHVFAWEFWNEVPPTPEQAKWVAEMASFLKRNDPYGHLVSTTYGNADVWKCPDVDFTMTHMYGQAGNTPLFTDQIVAHTKEHRPYGKPYLLAEFGIDWQTADSRWDPKAIGTNMHNGAWSALMAGGAGTAMLWYWDGYVHPGNLYGVFTPIRKFADAVDWKSEPLEPIAGIEVQTAPGTPETFKDLTVPATIEWGMPASDRYTVLHDGTVRGAPVAMAIGSPGRSTVRELPTKLTWALDIERPTTVTLKLGQVCTKAHMVIKVDGKVVVDRELTSGEPGKGPWKASRRLEQYNLWLSDYDEDIALDLPAGRREIEISNTDGDWFQIRSIMLPGYQSSRHPDVTALGLAGDRQAILWLHNRESTWRTDYDGKAPSVLEGLRVSVPVKHEGPWSVEWWDTWTGEVLRRETVAAADGVLNLLPPPLKRDVAVRMKL
ncbi:MAG: DUF5060 domain-containing protein [Armatimonadetes bacterium]|nr:DUF5060 domain-containing protein [Armatimonadota bacterium]